MHNFKPHVKGACTDYNSREHEELDAIAESAKNQMSSLIGSKPTHPRRDITPTVGQFGVDEIMTFQRMEELGQNLRRFNQPIANAVYEAVAGERSCHKPVYWSSPHESRSHK
jgi:hypothetical protein